ncbi:MAG: hypothetical protein IH987_18965 [Planctomycetes bacterium]|nr:hypothetical protein [Planctomycetota bacterium]
MQNNNRPWEVLASRFQEFFEFLRVEEDLDIAYEHLIGLAEKAGRDFYHLAQSGTIAIPNGAYWSTHFGMKANSRHFPAMNLCEKIFLRAWQRPPGLHARI